MTTPKRIIVDLATNTVTEVELQGEELETYNASLEAQKLLQSDEPTNE